MGFFSDVPVIEAVKGRSIYSKQIEQALEAKKIGPIVTTNDVFDLNHDSYISGTDEFALLGLTDPVFQYYRVDTYSGKVSLSLKNKFITPADLRGADLSGSDLENADFSTFGIPAPGAKLIAMTDLRGADLRGANLSGANFSGFHKNGIDADGAYLQGALFDDDTRLRGANFSGAQIDGATGLFSANIDDATGFSMIWHPLLFIASF